jgi:hypothetical protein
VFKQRKKFKWITPYKLKVVFSVYLKIIEWKLINILINKVDDCLNDRLVNLNNQTHGCLAFGPFDIQFDINKHLLIEGYKICPLNVSLNHLVYVQMNTKCRTKCLIECKEIHFENYNKFSRILDKNSTTKRIDVTPIKSTHTLKNWG